MHQYFLRYCCNARPNEFTQKTNLSLYSLQYFLLEVLKGCLTVVQLIYSVQVKQIFVCSCTVC